MEEEIPVALAQRRFLYLARNLGVKVLKDKKGPIMSEISALAKLPNRRSALSAFAPFAAKMEGVNTDPYPDGAIALASIQRSTSTGSTPIC